MSNTSFTHFIEIVQVMWKLTDLESDPSSSTWKINKLSSSISETANQNISCSRSVWPWPLLFMRHCQWLIGCWPSALMQSKALTPSPTSCQASCVSLGASTETQRTLVRSTAACSSGADSNIISCSWPWPPSRFLSKPDLLSSLIWGMSLLVKMQTWQKQKTLWQHGS